MALATLFLHVDDSDSRRLAKCLPLDPWQTLIPVDFQKAGHILDDDLYTHLVRKMAAGVNVTVLMDCCHSGSTLDLPYEINATQSEMSYNQGFNAGLLDDPWTVICCLTMCLYCLLEGM